VSPLCLFGQTEFRQKLSQPFSPNRSVGFHGFENGVDVVGDGKLSKNRGFLRKIRNAEARAAVHRQVRNLRIAEEDLARRGFHAARHHVEGGGLASTVRPQQPHDLSGLHLQINRPNHVSLAVAFGQRHSGQRAHG